jgi:transcriptional regulator with XRE-family HTH domain
MDWTTIRTQYRALLRQSGVTQADVARRGGLSGQNAISKLLANTHRGPSVETFIKAVDGLGLSLAEFFAAIEPPPRGAAVTGRSADRSGICLRGARACFVHFDKEAS